MIAFLLGPIGRFIAGGAVAFAILVGIWTHGYQKGKAHVQSQWDVAEARQLGKGVDARSAAEKAIPPVSDSADGAVPRRCVVRDKYDRDC